MSAATLEEPQIKNNYDTEDIGKTLLRRENYFETDDKVKVDKRLGLGTGDDEIVEKIVGAAKNSAGIAGIFINEKAVASSLRNNQAQSQQRR